MFTVCELGKSPIEIVDLPNLKMMIFYSYVKLPEGIVDDPLSPLYPQV